MPRMASSDPAYKILFSQRRMVEDTLRGYVAPDWCDALDFSTLTQMNTEYIGPELYNRIGDMLWRVEFQDGSLLGGPPLANGERHMPARPVRVSSPPWTPTWRGGCTSTSTCCNATRGATGR